MKYLMEDTNELVDERKLRDLLLEEELNDIKNNFYEYLDGSFNIDSQCECLKAAVHGDIEQVLTMLNENWNIPVKKLETNKYTALVIFKIDTTLEKLTEIQKEIQKFMVEMRDKNIIGKKDLAYEIQGQKQGYMIEYSFLSNAERNVDLERYFRLENNIIKFMIIKENR